MPVSFWKKPFRYAGLLMVALVAAALAAASPLQAQATAMPLHEFRVQVQAVNEAQAQLNFDAAFFGIEAFGAPIKITPDSPLIAKNPKGLIAFIASLIPVFQGFSDPAALEPYLPEGDLPKYRGMLSEQGMREQIATIYNGLESFELYCGWFIGPQEFLTVLKMVRTDGQHLYSPVQFTFASGEWKILFGADCADVVHAAAICMALDNPRRFQMRYRKALPEEGATMPAANWRSFF